MRDRGKHRVQPKARRRFEKHQQEENHTTPARPKFLNFIHHAEGYVKCTNMGQYMAYNYVYQYKDHLGNIRMNYAKNPQTGLLEIVDENHYYPFGLKHTNYNVDEKDFVKEDEILELKVPPIKTAPYQYKFQEQEWQDELGLGWYSFKWRNYDPAIGRFFNIDPLAEKYAYQSPYNFSENRVIDARELEGLEAEVIFNKSSNTLLITPDKSKWKPNLPTKIVEAKNYNANDKKHNQQILVKGVFSGGESSNGVVERDSKKPEQKAIPNGTYDILDNNADTRHEGWFRLDKQDGENYNDKDDATGRDGFRFHTGSLSWGCVTVDSSDKDRSSEWDTITKILESTTTETVPEKRGNQAWNPFSWLTKFGTMKVVGNDNTPVK